MRRVKESLHVVTEDDQSPKMFYRGGNWLQVVSVIDEWLSLIHISMYTALPVTWITLQAMPSH